MSSDSARTAHALASQITSARLRGDLAEANRLVKLFNQQLAVSRTSKPSVIHSQTDVKESINRANELINTDISIKPKTDSSPEVAKKPIDTVRNNLTIPVPRPAKPGSLAEAVLGNKSPSDNNDSIPNLESVLAPENNPDPFSYLTTKQVKSEPVLPNFDDLISSYHPGVQSLLNKALNEVSDELQIPKQVLGPSLVTEFESLWRSKQRLEPLLLKLPKHIQQRSVLLRYQSELLERLQ